ncbi:hypothetical protein BDN72DRAFT_320230 [Pluteus cervinus]|uniref:Uncharacterized protein n=1 Tax=Pluteus cervinus TaxID=181527 RepID=A0ACD3ACM6_9AGAR|nr:hypothetical protein BDN72DRAFT_320230 [Pluteus cervinus]
MHDGLPVSVWLRRHWTPLSVMVIRVSNDNPVSTQFGTHVPRPHVFMSGSPRLLRPNASPHSRCSTPWLRRYRSRCQVALFSHVEAGHRTRTSVGVLDSTRHYSIGIAGSINRVGAGRRCGVVEHSTFNSDLWLAISTKPLSSFNSTTLFLPSLRYTSLYPIPPPFFSVEDFQRRWTFSSNVPPTSGRFDLALGWKR